MTLGEAYKKGTELLKHAGKEAPANDAGVLLCMTLGCDRAYIYAHGADMLDDTMLSRYMAMLERRAAGEPLQYLSGTQEFMSLSFAVGPGVLIPRQDTELLVETVISFGKARGGPLEILDMGTGSGCIAVSLAHYLPGCRVTATDKMPEALAIARRNALANGVAERVEFIRSDLFDALAGRQFDAVVSNPPYIRTDEIGRLQEEVRSHEPREALDGGTDGLDFYRRITSRASQHLKAGGLLAFETGYGQAPSVAAFMAEHFRRIRIHKDLAGVDRVVEGIPRQNVVCIQNPT